MKNILHAYLTKGQKNVTTGLVILKKCVFLLVEQVLAREGSWKLFFVHFKWINKSDYMWNMSDERHLPTRLRGLGTKSFVLNVSTEKLRPK